jgi:hypothetical protein
VAASTREVLVAEAAGRKDKEVTCQSAHWFTLRVNAS